MHVSQVKTSNLHFPEVSSSGQKERFAWMAQRFAWMVQLFHPCRDDDPTSCFTDIIDIHQ
ncbi:hypothetical protein TSUD_119080 [Trifolium subterraneum]|uniref:Uncharacterized protein n=1 Tax=Trifolium subterraneum TaxID=3900 RepID=A0A2Z6NB32_TRISU|nr:hypothetical protein TSUD_119080 [Trifolium subterraneum]